MFVFTRLEKPGAGGGDNSIFRVDGSFCSDGQGKGGFILTALGVLSEQGIRIAAASEKKNEDGS